MMTAEESDARVLAALRKLGPGRYSVKLIAAEAQVPRVTVISSVMALLEEGLVCALHDSGETSYIVQHLHAGCGRCEESIGSVVMEIHPDHR